MKHWIVLAAFLTTLLSAAEESPDDATIRNDIQLRGGLKPIPKVGAFMVVEIAESYPFQGLREIPVKNPRMKPSPSK